ncbi:MAG: UDP-N-acetylmuramoyl-tripeptide--D-alanyl-D-alanine ligase [Gemmatimonadota bacterium]
MIAWTDANVTAALGLLGHSGGEARSYTAVSTDTRSIGPGSLFVALRGERHDAHDYLGQAAEAGARGAVVDRVPTDAPATLRYHVVPDTLAALGRLARFHRRRMGARVCAVAGSNGKTTTKEMLRHVLGARYHVHATHGNLNNLIGLPLTLLGAPSDVDVVVVEVGTNVPGEVARLAAIAEPDAVVITTVSDEHLEGLGDLEGVLREETSLLPWLPRKAPAVVGDEPEELGVRASQLADAVHIAGFSDRAEPIFRGFALDLDDEGRARFRWAGRDVALRLRGRHNGRNALIALAMGRLWGVDDERAIQALGRMEPQAMRGETRQFGDMLVIADCYNSNPGSLDAALDLLVSLPRAGGRVAVLGSMLELGERSADLHRAAARRALAAELDLIVATGAFAPAFREEAIDASRLVVEENVLRAFDLMSVRLRGDEVVLLKGSRGVQLERLLPLFEAHWGVLHPHGEAFGSRASDTFTGDCGDAAPAEHPSHSAEVEGESRGDAPDGRGG